MKWLISFVFGALGILLLMLGKQQDTSVEIKIIMQYLGIILGVIAGLLMPLTLGPQNA